MSVDSAAIIEALRKVDQRAVRSLTSWERKGIGRDAALRRPVGAARGPYQGSAMNTYGQSSLFRQGLHEPGSPRYNRPFRENSRPLRRAVLKEIALPFDLQSFGSPFLPFTQNRLYPLCYLGKPNEHVHMVGHYDGEPNVPNSFCVSVFDRLDQIGAIWSWPTD